MTETYYGPISDCLGYKNEEILLYNAYYTAYHYIKVNN